LLGGALQGEEQLVSSHDAPIHLAGGTLNQHRHVCAFFDSIEEEIRVLAPFISDGLNRGEMAAHIIDPMMGGRYVQLLEQAGVPVRAAMQQGQFALTTWEHAYFRTDGFDKFAMLAYIEESAAKARADGFLRVRSVGHMEWALSGRDGCEQLIDYESRVNDANPDSQDIAICVYDTNRFGASISMDVLRTHPAAIIGGELRENHYYVSPAEYLASSHDSAYDLLSS
jgi:MEDS: MEthanogen/methylotroph, DcmR Sensory domain